MLSLVNTWQGPHINVKSHSLRQTSRDFELGECCPWLMACHGRAWTSWADHSITQEFWWHSNGRSLMYSKRVVKEVLVFCWDDFLLEVITARFPIFYKGHFAWCQVFEKLTDLSSIHILAALTESEHELDQTEEGQFFASLTQVSDRSFSRTALHFASLRSPELDVGSCAHELRWTSSINEIGVGELQLSLFVDLIED
jgi:hypothetical protein